MKKKKERKIPKETSLRYKLFIWNYEHVDEWSTNFHWYARVTHFIWHKCAVFRYRINRFVYALFNYSKWKREKAETAALWRRYFGIRLVK